VLRRAFAESTAPGFSRPPWISVVAAKVTKHIAAAAHQFQLLAFHRTSGVVKFDNSVKDVPTENFARFLTSRARVSALTSFVTRSNYSANRGIPKRCFSSLKNLATTANTGP
jgi:hypothetical protein